VRFKPRCCDGRGLATGFSVAAGREFCQSRAESFMNTTAVLRPLTLIATLGLSALTCHAEVNKVEKIADEVYFHEGEIKPSGHCNNGWIIFEDYVVVIDANFPSGARVILPKIRALTDKPIRFTFDTHHHGDHAYANQVWVDNGATPVAHIGVLDEMKKHETALFGGKPGRWEDAAKGRKDLQSSKLKAPTLLYRTEMIFDDGKHRVELLHFGTAHTHGDGWAWLPKEKILFSGDACVNGPYNFTGDGNIGEWIKTLEAVKKLGPKIICPGHGPIGGSELLEDQQAYFRALLDEVKKFSGREPAEIEAAVPEIMAALKKNERIARYAGNFLPAQVEKAFIEQGGKPWPKPEIPKK
jgi:glyoxylase-like metal-dependent hydrolase (beta-lactamase superfamily II)